MLIEDHSITYINLQDKSGMKFDSKDNVSEIINYRNKLFEYKKDNYYINYSITYEIDTINPNENHLKINYSYLESNIIEDYRITLFVVIKENRENIFKLYDNSDHSLTLLHVDSSISNTDNLILTFTTTNISTSKTLFTNLSNKKKKSICISWNGVNSAVYTNGKRIHTFNHSGVGSTTSGTHRYITPDDGKLYEFIIFNSLNLNDEIINSINRYLANKHDITLLV